MSFCPRLPLLLATLLAFLPILFFMGGCAVRGSPPAVLQGSFAAGGPQYRMEVDSLGRKHGAERWWHENGALKLEATWRAGKRDGVYRAFHPDGAPWYQGRDSLGVPVDTLRFWHPNGMLQSLSVFAGGEPVSLETFDSLGRTPQQRLAEERRERARAEARQRADSLAALEGPRQRALAEWTGKVRASVETYWSLPESMKKTPRRAVARIQVASTGVILGATWPEKSGSPEFDRRAAQALTRVKRFPPFPPELGTVPLAIRYEFTTPGLQPPRRKLRVKEPGNAED